MSTIFRILYKLSRILPGGSLVLRFFYACDIPRGATIGSGVIFNHNGLGTVIHPYSIVGNNVAFEHHVLLGQRNGSDKSAPIIGDNVHLGSYCIVLGGVSIGNNSTIGAGTLVLHDVPDNTIYCNKRESLAWTKKE